MREVQAEAINAVEWAVLAATLVLSARLFALIQATRGVPDAHSQVSDAVGSADLEALEERARGLGYRNPYGEVAADVINVAAREMDDEAKRPDLVARATRTATRRVIRRTQQGQGMDMAALAVAVGIIVFSRETLPTGPLFWSLAGAILILLVLSLLVRAQLKASVLSRLEALRTLLENRPRLPSLSGAKLPCLWCGAKLREGSFSLEAADGSLKEQVRASVCIECGKFVATLPPGDSRPA